MIRRDLFGFDVQIIQNFNMFADKTDRRDDNFIGAFGSQVPDHVSDVRFEPRVRRFAAAALIGEEPALMAQSLGDELCGGLQLIDVR